MSGRQAKQSRKAFRPDGVAPNCCLPHEAQLIQQLFSASGWDVIEAMTTKAGGMSKQMANDDWVCRMPQHTIAARARTCIKTVFNTLEWAKEIGLASILERETQGGKITLTVYIIRAYTPVLAALRKNPKYFHTAEGHVVTIGRRPRIMTPADAERWQLDPAKPPRPRLGGHIATSRYTQKQYEPHPMDIEHVTDALRRADCTVSDRANALKAIEVAQVAWIEAGNAGDMPGDTIAMFIQQIGKEYKPNARYAKPALGWFIKFLPPKIKAWGRMQAHARTG